MTPTRYEFNGETDRVYLLLYHPPDALAELISQFKDVWSRRRQQYFDN